MSFYVGQKVVCVYASKPWLEKDAVYTVQRFLEVCGCGYKVDVGARHDQSGTKCSGCGNFRYGSSVLFDARRFRPLDALTEQMDRIESDGNSVEHPEPAFA